MSGDVQPRKRKDKKRKKDELGVEEPRGTAAVLGEGDVFIHSHHEHGTGGHWCAKIIFFSLLAVLVTLVGLIILENQGLTELEANSVESRYSGVLDGWIEDTPDDDHHDEHTLELLKHHDDEDDHNQEHDISQEDEDDTSNHDENESGHDDDGENDQEASNEEKEEEDDDEHDDDDDDEGQDEEDERQDEEHEGQDVDDDEQDEDDEEQIENNESQQDDDNSEEQQLEEADEDDDDEPPFENDESGGENEADDLQKVDEIDSEEDDDDNFQSNQVDDESTEKDDANSHEDEDDEEEHEENDEEVTDSAIEVEKLEKEVPDEDTASEEESAQETEEDDKSQEISSELSLEDNLYATDDVKNVEDEEYLEDDIDVPPPVVERFVAPKGKPLPEVEDEHTTAKPADTLADEEEYEKQQEELRREEAQASHVWLKLAVGGALLVATHAVVSRAVAPRDETPASEGHAIREDTPLIERRMTLVPEEPPANASPKEVVEENVRPINDFKKTSLNKSVTPPSKEESEEDVEEEEDIIDRKDITGTTSAVDLKTKNKELFSDDEDEDEFEEEEDVIVEQKRETKQAPPVSEKIVEPEPDEAEMEDVADDVEIIDDEHLGEELEEEEDDEEEISDVDDAELLTRLEAKYGRLPEPERAQKHKDGGNSIEDDWPGEPTDKYWRQQLDEAEQELRQGAWSAALARASAARLRGSARARWQLARALDAQAEAQRDNRLLSRAIAAYLDVLKLNERLTDARLRQIASRTLDRIRFRGNYLSAEPIYRLLIRRFPDVVDYRNNLTVSFLMANRADLAEEVIKETLRTWPDDRVALAHLGFILKTQHNRLEEAVEALQKALEGDVEPVAESRFYYHLGDALLLLNRFTEAHEVHKRGAKLGHFLSPAQRSLYNVNRLKSRPWWDIEQTPYLKLARALEKSWKDILKEGQAAQALYEKEKEGLKERGEWSQLDLFVRGQEVPGRCKKAPITCSIVRAEKASAGCRRGQIKFSAMEAGTHVRPHVGPTNCRLRMHLGLSNTKDTYIRVDQETRQWQVGKVFMFDDSFEHEVWHNGTGTRLVLIVDVWHPALSAGERRDLPPI